MGEGQGWRAWQTLQRTSWALPSCQTSPTQLPTHCPSAHLPYPLTGQRCSSCKEERHPALVWEDTFRFSNFLFTTFFLQGTVLAAVVSLTDSVLTIT